MILGRLGLTPTFEPPPEPEPEESPESSDSPRTLIGARLPIPGVTFREAVLTSLLAHAVAVIIILLTPPGTFSASDADVLLAQQMAAEGDKAVPLEFIQDRPRPPEPNPGAKSASDRDRRRAQSERPDDPKRPEPFSRGNTPAKIAEGMIAPPAPAPPASPSEPAASDPPAGKDSSQAPEAETTQKGFEAPEGSGAFYVPSPSSKDRGGKGDEESAEKARRLRETLARMGAQGSMGGDGSPYRFDNPVGGLDTPTGSLSFDTKGFDWGDYARRIYWIIWSNWHARMPPAIYTGQKGVVTVRFVIERDGKVSEIKILSPSGVPAYDSAASLALEASDPLPPLPDNFPEQREGVTGRFLYNMWERD